MDASDRAERLRQLTPRHREVLSLAAQGLTTPQIAVALAISERTAAHHVQSAIERLGAHNRTQAYALMVGRGD